MSIPQEFILPYVLSNAIAILLLIAAWKRPKWARVLFFLVFAWASWTNIQAVSDDPGQYLDYASFTFLPFYKNFINGFFSDHIQAFVISIGICQLCIAIGMLLKVWIYKLGVLGAILFFVAIAPLGIGSAFPCTLICAISMVLLLGTGKDYIWRKD